MAILTPKHTEHHAKVRKFELVLLALLIVAIVAGAALGYIWYQNAEAAKKSAEEARQQLELKSIQERQFTVRSKHGFSVTYDKSLFEGQASVRLDDGRFEIYKEAEIGESRDYALVELSGRFSSDDPATRFDYSTFRAITNVRQDSFKQAKEQLGANATDIEAAEKLFTTASNESRLFTEVKREQTNLNGVDYLYKEFDVTNPQLGISAIKAKKFEYITVQNGRPYVIRIEGNKETAPNLEAFKNMVKDVKYFAPDADAKLHAQDSDSEPPRWVAAVHAQEDGAAAASPVSQSQIKVVAKNTPATVLVNTTYCVKSVEVRLANQSFPFVGGCIAARGSGFFLSSDGYIGTNGHVVDAGPGDVISSLVASGNRPNLRQLIKLLLAVEGRSVSDEQLDQLTARVASSPESLSQIAQAASVIPEEAFTSSGEQSQYAIQLGTERAEENRTNHMSSDFYVYNDKVVKAEFIDQDFNKADLVSEKGFTASDVAILKVSGENYPYTVLGSIEGLTSGSDLTVIGFPAIADALRDEKAPLKATATKGIVSAITEAPGNRKKLIQSDVSIGGGNSGGPAFNNTGEVVGIATYGVEVPGSNLGKVNYMRDVQDLVDLVSKKGIQLNQQSATQTEWEKGLDNFLKARYSKAVKHFAKVQELYPQHSLAAEYTALANQKIANGEEATSPVALVVLLVLVGGGSVGIAIVVKKHRGNLPPAPAAPGAPASPSAVSLPEQPTQTYQADPISTQPMAQPSGQPPVVPTAQPITPAQAPVAPDTQPPVVQPAAPLEAADIPQRDQQPAQTQQPSVYYPPGQVADNDPSQTPPQPPA